MAIERLRYAYHTVSDFDRAIRFYGEGLKLPLRFRDGSNWAEFVCGEGRFAISSAQEAALGASQPVVSVFQAANAAEMEADIVRMGGQKVSERDMGSHGRLVTYTDSEGVAFQIFSPPAG